jgi:hypothetical protein
VATLLALDGAEYGVVVAGVGVDAIVGTPTIVTSPVRTGSRAWSISAAAAAETVAYTIASTIASVCVYVRFATLPTTEVRLVGLDNANGDAIVRFDGATTGKFGVTAGASATVTGGPDVVVDQWYRIVLEGDASGGTMIARFSVDGSADIEAQNVQASANFIAAYLGSQNVATFTAHFDDWLVSVTDGDYEEMAGWDSHRVESLIPNADGSHNITTSGDFDSFTATAFSNATTNGNTFIAHRPLQRANTANQVIRQELGTTANYMEFANENLSDNADPVDGVRTYATHIEAVASGASLGEARLLLADNTEVLTTGSLSAINSTEDPGTTVTTRDRMTIAPAGGWDGTKVDGLKWRIGFADNAPDVNFIDLMVEVALHVEGGTDGVATPATVAAVAAVPASTAQGAAVTAPATVAAVGAVPAPVASGGGDDGSASPATVAAIAAIPTPTARGAGSTAPATVAAIAAVPAPIARGAARTTPTTVVATATVPAPTAQGAAVTSPATVAAIGAVPAPVASGEGGGDATASPATVAAVAAIPASIARGAAIISPATVGAVAAVPAPIARGAARTTPATVAALAAVPAPMAGSSNQANPATVAAIATVPASIGRGAGVASPLTVAAIATIPAPSFPSQVQVFITEGDADASTDMESGSAKADSLEGGVLMGAGLES